jgi:hypothetical protein
MAPKKIDGVIEAVQYTTHGELALVRAYERHGVVWSDHVILPRGELLKRLMQGKRFAVGRRKLYLGSVFEIGAMVKKVNGYIVSEDQEGTHDNLGGVPLF